MKVHIVPLPVRDVATAPFNRRSSGCTPATSSEKTTVRLVNWPTVPGVGCTFVIVGALVSVPPMLVTN